MRIAIAVDEKNENAFISKRAGRASYYLVFNEKGDLLETLDNPFARGGGGAGYGVAKMLSDRKVDVAIAGRMGDNMKEALISRRLRFGEISEGSAKNAAARYASGQ
jgi:predicted Fe-Mo cluster-binding NifX family protein